MTTEVAFGLSIGPEAGLSIGPEVGLSIGPEVGLSIGLEVGRPVGPGGGRTTSSGVGPTTSSRAGLTGEPEVDRKEVNPAPAMSSDSCSRIDSCALVTLLGQRLPATLPGEGGSPRHRGKTAGRRFPV